MYRPMRSTVPLLAILTLVVVLPTLQLAMAQTYWIDELPPLSSGVRSLGLGINDAGIVVGQTAYPAHAVRWVNGVPTDLGVVPGYSISIAWDISNDNRVVGRSGTDCGSADATLWAGPFPMALPDVPRVHAEVYSINDAGIAVGEGFDSCYPPWNNLAYQWQYQQGTWVVSPLPQLAGDPEGTAFGVNNAGVVVGYSGNSSAAQFRAVRWDSGVASLVPDLGGDYSIARAINDVGQVAGYSKTAAGTFWAYFFDGTTAVDLGTLPGYEYSVAWGVNNAGTVIGCAFNNWQWPYNIEALYHCAFVWQDGVQHRLSDLIPPGSGWTSLNVATAINARGQITGFGMRPSGTRAFLLTPIVPGDLNCDGSVNFGDINPFVLILSNPTGWQQTYPDCPFLNGDINGDGNVNFGDINPFVALLSGG